MTTDLFAGINDGDQVTTRQDYIFRGIKDIYARLETQNDGVYLVPLGQIRDVTVLRRALPPEPPIGSVVRCEGCGHVHMRVKTGWVDPETSQAHTWGTVNGEDGDGPCGPVRVLWTPEADK